jgi:hypothetical protein
MFTNSTKDIQDNQKVENTTTEEEVEEYLPGFMAFIGITEQ